jgi:hypothetical protein
MVRTFTRLAVLPLAFLGLLAFGGAQAQLPRTLDEPQPLKPPAVEVPLKAVPPAEARTVDELVSKLEALRKQKAEIEKQEKAVAEELKARFKQLEERLAKLGVLPGTPPIVDAPLQIFPGSAPPKPK